MLSMEKKKKKKNPNQVLDLLPLSNVVRVRMGAEEFAGHIKVVHEQIREQLKLSSQAYKSKVDAHRICLEFKEGDLVKVYLQKERFRVGTYEKLKQRKFGPCQELRRFGQNKYCIELPKDFSISPIFNVSDLYLYHGDEVKIVLKPTDVHYDLSTSPK